MKTHSESSKMVYLCKCIGLPKQV